MQKKGGFMVIREEEVNAQILMESIIKMEKNKNIDKINSCKIIIEKIKEINE